MQTINPVNQHLPPAVPPPMTVCATLQQAGEWLTNDKQFGETTFESLKRFHFYSSFTMDAQVPLNSRVFTMFPFTDPNGNRTFFNWSALPLACSKYFQLVVKWHVVSSKAPGATGKVCFFTTVDGRGGTQPILPNSTRAPKLIWDLTQSQSISFELVMNSIFPLLPHANGLPVQVATNLSPGNIDPMPFENSFVPPNVGVSLLAPYRTNSVYPDTSDFLIFRDYEIIPYTMTDPRRHRNNIYPWNIYST